MRRSESRKLRRTTSAPARTMGDSSRQGKAHIQKSSCEKFGMDQDSDLLQSQISAGWNLLKSRYCLGGGGVFEKFPLKYPGREYQIDGDQSSNLISMATANLYGSFIP